MGATHIALPAWLVLSAAVVLGPSAVVVIDAGEAWPWTCAPMFAEPHHDDTAFYEPRLIVETATGEEPFSSKPLRIPDWHFRRLLLVKAYGAMSSTSPFGHIADDTPAAFEARLDAFFDAALASHKKARQKQLLPAGARAIRLELARVLPAAAGPAVHVVGRYDLATRTFRREAWERR